MFKNPFGPTVVDAGPTSVSAKCAMIGQGVEVRYSSTSRVMVPGAILLSGVTVPVILYFMLPAPFNATMAGVTAVMEFGTAALLWFLFNSAFVRADETGVTKAQFGRAQCLSWSQIHRLKTVDHKNSPQTTYQLQNRSGQVLLEFSDFGNKSAGAKLRGFIEAKLKKR